MNRPTPPNPMRYAPSAHEASELDRYIERFRLLLAKAQGARAVCLACGLALATRLRAGTPRRGAVL